MEHPHKYTSEYFRVENHGRHKLHVVCTTEADDVEKMLGKMFMMLGGRRREERFVGVDVEFNPDVDVTKHPQLYQREAVLQLCVDNEVLVYHISAAAARPQRLPNFLDTGHFTYVGFSIATDKRMLELVGIVIRPERYIDIQREWRIPNNLYKPYDSLAYVASMVIDPYYKTMKSKITREEDHIRRISIIKRGLKRSQDDWALRAEEYSLDEIYGPDGAMQYD